MRVAVVVVAGRGRSEWADAAVGDYGRRIRRYAALEELRVRAEAFRDDVEAVRLAEAERVERLLGERDQLVVLDERGADLDTPGLTRWLDHGRSNGVYRVVFAIGGAYGHHAGLRDRAHRVLRLSPMVLNHEVARVVLYEQLYRSFAAIAGVPYAH